MFRKILMLGLALCSVFFYQSAQALDTSSVFGAMGTSTNLQGPGSFSSQTRNVYMGGGASLRVPVQQMNLFSLTPPSFDVGCSGISATFGGFSFINGQEIQTLIKTISQNATGLVMELVIKTLCPQCEAVLQVMEHLAQEAAKLAVDSCHAGEYLANFVGKETGLSPGNATGHMPVCGAMVTTYTNESTDFLSGMQSMCQGADQSLNNITSGLNNLVSDPNQKAALEHSFQMGNETWLTLKGVGYNPDDANDYQNMTLLMNVIGTVIVEGSTATASVSGASGTSAASAPTTSTTSGASNSTNLPGTASKPTTRTIISNMDAVDVNNYLMCGAKASTDPTVANATGNYCDTWYARLSANNFTVLSCDNDKVACKSPQTIQLSQATFLQGPGYIAQVATLLNYGVKQVISNADLYNATDTQGQQLLTLLQRAPYPLYQLINAAAVYPDAAQRMLTSMSVILAETLTYQEMQTVLSTTGRVSDGYGVQPQMAQRLSSAMEKLRLQSKADFSAFGAELAAQEQIQLQIQQINKTIQKQVMTSQMLGNQRFVSSIMKSQTGATSNAPSN